MLRIISIISRTNMQSLKGATRDKSQFQLFLKTQPSIPIKGVLKAKIPGSCPRWLYKTTSRILMKKFSLHLKKNFIDNKHTMVEDLSQVLPTTTRMEVRPGSLPTTHPKAKVMICKELTIQTYLSPL